MRIEADEGSMLLVTGSLMLTIEKAPMIGA